MLPEPYCTNTAFILIFIVDLPLNLKLPQDYIGAGGISVGITDTPIPGVGVLQDLQELGY